MQLNHLEAQAVQNPDGVIQVTSVEIRVRADDGWVEPADYRQNRCRREPDARYRGVQKLATTRSNPDSLGPGVTQFSDGLRNC